MKRIGIIFGGRSSEHEISLLSAASVIRTIDKEKYSLEYIGITKGGVWKHVDTDRAVMLAGPGYVKARGESTSAQEKRSAEASAVAQLLESGYWADAAKPVGLSEVKEMIDFALPIVHGPYCEDGRLQGIFEMLGIPYGGCGVLASAVAMDKLTAKDVFARYGLPICKHVAAFRADYDEDKAAVWEAVENELGYPCFVKPANMGSSVGITKAHDREELKEALKLAFKYDKRLIIEEGIDARELETGIIGNARPEASAVGEILAGAEFYDYDAKYSDGCSTMSIPAKITDEQREEIRSFAVKAYKAIDGEGFARVDFFIDRGTGKVYLNEINTIPGFTKYSMFPMLWEEAGVPYKESIERIIELGYERYNTENNRQTII